MSRPRYLVVFEGGGATNFSAWVPDLPGCGAAGRSQEECERAMRTAISWHIDGLRAGDEPVPEPSAVGARFIEAD